MIERVIVRRLAQQDIREARLWYRKISPALADDFLAQVRRAITLAQEYPLGFQVVHRTFRRIPLHRFPYGLFYHADEQRIVIVAVLHQARDREILAER